MRISKYPEGALGIFSARNSGTQLFEGDFTTSGRVALLRLLSKLVPANSLILFPAYHCIALSETCLNAGYRISYYRISENFHPELDDIRSILDAERVEAIVLIHPFGVILDSSELANICKESSTYLIEDVAHFDTNSEEIMRKIPFHGDALIASPRKFYGVYDGGFLMCKKGVFTRKSQRKRFGYESRSIKYFLSKSLGNTSVSLEYSRIEKTPKNSDIREMGYIDPRFDPNGQWVISTLSKFILKNTSTTKVHSIRSRNYEGIVEGLRNLSTGRVVLETEPLNAYVVPYFIDDPNTYYAIRDAGIEAMRWEGISAMGCPVADLYQDHLIQLPCHQSMNGNDVDFVCETLKSLQ